MPDVIVHHLQNSRSQRILWLLEELEVPYEVVCYQRDRKTMRAPASLRKIHPLGKAPVVTVDGTVLAESGAIIEELVETFGGGRLRPTDVSALRQYRYFLHYAEGSLMPPLLVRLIFDTLQNPPVPALVKLLARPLLGGIAGGVDKAFTGPEIANHFAFLDGVFAERDYCTGDTFSAADIQLSFPVMAGLERARLAKDPKHVRAWLARIEGRPGWRKVLERWGSSGILD